MFSIYFTVLDTFRLEYALLNQSLLYKIWDITVQKSYTSK